MTVLYHPLIFVAVLITSQANAVTERKQRDGDQVSVGDQVRAHAAFNLNTETQLSAEIGEGGADKDQTLQNPKGFSYSESLESGESFEAETNVVIGYDGEDQYNGVNTFDKDNYLLPSRGFMTAAQAINLTEVQTGEKSQNVEILQADATAQSELQTQFGKQAKYGAESQANAIIQENQEIQYSKSSKVLPPPQGIMQFPYGTIPGPTLNYGLVMPSVYSGNTKNTFKENSVLGPPSNLLNKPGQERGSLYAVLPNKVPSSYTTYAYGDPFVGTTPQVDRHTAPKSQQSLLVSNTGIEKIKPMANGYETTQSPNWIPYQKGNPNKSLMPTDVVHDNKNWNPYTKPAEGETLLQAEGEIQSDGKAEADTAAQENGNQSPHWSPYQKENPNKSFVPSSVVSPNGYNNNNNWNSYTKPAEGETLVQAEGEIQNSGKIEVDTATQENGNQSPNWIPYHKGNPNKSLVPTDVVSPNGYNNNQNWNSYTKPAEGETLVHAEEKIQSIGKAETDTIAQKNGNQSPHWSPYQKENPNKSFVLSDVVSPNGYNNNKKWNSYTKPAEGETLVQAEGEIQSNGKAKADTTAQKNGNQSPHWSPYQKENPNKSFVPSGVVSPNGYNNNNNWNSYTKPAEGETLVQAEGEIQNSGKVKADTAALEMSNRNLNRIPYQKRNPNKSLMPTNVVSLNGYNNNQNWSPYTKPSEGETLIQAEREIQTIKPEADTAAQDTRINNRSPAGMPDQKGNPNVSIVPIDVISPYGYSNNKNWKPYTKPAEGKILVQAKGEIQSSQLNSGSQYEPSIQTDIEAYSNGGFQYSGEDKVTSAAKVNAEAQTNIASIYSGGSPYNWGAHGLAAVQTSEGLKYEEAQNSESSLYGNINKYNGGYLNGQGNVNSHLQNGAQFGAAAGAETVVQDVPVLESRFFQTTHPARRPLPAYGYRQSRNGWNQW